MPTFEFRKLFRTNIILKIRYRLLSNPEKEGIAFSKNISSTGVNIIMPEALEKGTELKLEIYLSEDQPPISAEGQALWQVACLYAPKSKRRYYSTGILFSFMPNEDAIKTSDFVRSALKRQSEDENQKIITMIEEISSGNQ